MADFDKATMNRRRLFGFLAVALAAPAAVLSTTDEAEAKRGGRGRGGGRPFGWSRGRKRGWSKKGGPKWRW
jgi:hypothetical protein